MKRLAIVASFLLAACAADRVVPRLDLEWEYALSEPGSEPPRDAAAWHEEADGDGRRDVWVRSRLPLEGSGQLNVVLRAYVGDMTLSVDRVPVYVYRQPAQRGRLTLHVIPLPPEAVGQRIYIHVPRAPEEAYFGTEPIVVTDESLSPALDRTAIEPIRSNARGMLIALVVMIVGIGAAGASVLRRRGDSRTLLWFGVFTLLYGARLAFESFLPLLFGASLRTNAFVIAFITYAITVPAWAVAVRLIGPGWKSSLRWQVLVFAAFAPIGIVADLVTGRPGSLETVNSVLVVIGGTSVIVNSLAQRRKSSLELRVVLAGASLFLLFALNNNLAALDLLPWESADETLGFLVFISCLGFAAVRSFLRSEREQTAIENELRTAREIQLSILPRTMPDVSGLAFQARYEPASSVAGDLYDFLRVDGQHTGVLVADVSGHGVPAALIASMVKIAVTSQADRAGDPAALLASVDATLRRDVRRAFVTATYLWLDMEQRQVTLCNAGHPQPLLFRGNTVLELGVPGPLLGRFASATFQATTSPLEPGDRIVAYTDGIVEARNRKGEPFGEERLTAMARHSTPEEIVDAVRAWRVEDEEADDLTVVIVDVA